MSTNADTIRAHYAASDAGDLAGMLAPITPTTRWTEAAGFPCAGTYVGPEAVRDNVFAVLPQLFDGFRLDVERVIDGGDTVVGLGTYSGTHRGTGKPFTARVAHVWTFEGETLASFEQVTDTLLVAEAMA